MRFRTRSAAASDFSVVSVSNVENGSARRLQSLCCCGGTRGQAEEQTKLTIRMIDAKQSPPVLLVEARLEFGDFARELGKPVLVERERLLDLLL